MKLSASFLALAFAGLFSASAAAGDKAIAPDATWHEFTVDSQVAPSFGTDWIDFNDGSTLTFTFTIGAGQVGLMSVVDAGFAGDTFRITNNGTLFGETSSVAAGTTLGNVVGDFDNAFADASFSRASFTLTAGSYRIGGRLDQSVTDNGAPLNSTNGAVRVSLVSAVPEPSGYALLCAGLAAVGFTVRRRIR